MIISASRRTDIPAFYGKWFLERLRAGFAYVRNPFRPRQVTRVELHPELVDCIVFWTKNPAPLLSDLDSITDLGYNFYFQFTLTPYDRTIEGNLPEKKVLVRTFQELAARIGPARVVWRYDPIILSEDLTIAKHVELFAQLAAELKDSCERCVISFLDFYAKTKRNTRGLGFLPIGPEDMEVLGREPAAVARSAQMEICTCSEAVDLSPWGVKPGKCIDDELVSRITGRSLSLKRDRNQRASCGCVESIDLGAYNTCLHQCRYCYANADHAAAKANWTRHDPAAPLLHGRTSPQDEIRVRRA